MEEGLSRNSGAGMVAESAATEHCKLQLSFLLVFVKIRSNCSKGIMLYLYGLYEENMYSATVVYYTSNTSK